MTYKFFVVDSGSLRLRITNCRAKSEMGLQIKTTPEELVIAMNTPRGRKSVLGKRINAYSFILDRIGSTIAEDGRRDMDAKEIMKLFGIAAGFMEPEEKTDMFLPYFERFRDSKRTAGTRSVYQQTIDRMKAFDKSLPRRKFEDITLGWLTDFEAFCALTASKNARNIHLRNIRAVFNNAIDNEITTAYPFRRFKIRPEATRKRSLTVDELRRLFAYKVEPYAQIYLDLFKLTFMLIGINSVDLFRLNGITREGRIEYKRAKTHKLYSIKVEPEAMEIIEKYKGVKGLLCIADRWSDHRNFTHQCNKALQHIGKVKRVGHGGKKIIEPEWPMLTTYWSRHSWATIAYELGISKDIIAQALGHSDDGYSTTNIYIREDSRFVDEANRRVLDWVLYGKR